MTNEPDSSMPRTETRMPFVNEVIPEDRKEKFAFPVQRLHNGMCPTLYMWVIDSEKNFYLVKTAKEGNGYDGVREQNTFYFHAYGENVRIKATPWGSETSKDEQWVYRWKITEIALPVKLRDRSKNMTELIVSAFKVWGWQNDGDNYDDVVVEVLNGLDS